MYVVTNGSHYLKTNTKLTSHINEAKKFPNITLAEKCKIGMKRTFKKMGIWNVVEYEESTFQHNQNMEMINVANKVSSITILDKNIKSFALAENISDNYKKMLSYKSSLEKIIAEKEKETQDILHFVEFYDLDAYNGYLIYKKLQQTRIERRNAKDELVRVNTFLKADLETVSNWKINTKEKKSYTPRILVDLFKRKWKLHTDKRKDIKDEED